jgi:hypothetical protein
MSITCQIGNLYGAELGRLPLRAKISFPCIKFWEHLLTSENALVFKIVQATKNFNP